MTIRYEIAPFRKDGKANVRIVIQNGRGPEGRERITTNIFVTRRELMSDGKRLKRGRTLDAIEEFIVEAKKKYASKDIIQQKVPTKRIRDIITGNDNYALPPFFRFAEKWLANTTIKGKKNYQSTINSFREFLRSKDEMFTDIEFKDINFALLTEYSASLADKPRAQSMYLGHIRHLWEQADIRYDEDMPKTPFKKFRVPKQKRVGQRATTISILNKVYAYEPIGKRDELARDCIILSFCLMGMNAADLYDCSVLSGNTIKYNRVKTRDRRQDSAHMEVDIHPFIQPIVDKYRDDKKVFSFHKMYAKEPDFQRAINLGIKTILGVNSDVTFYSFRHLWATIARNDIRAPKSDVNDALVHIDKDMDVTDLYILKDYSIVNELNTKVIEFAFRL